MANPASAGESRQEAESLIRRALPGDKRRVADEARKAGRLAEWIWRRYQVGVWQWQAKHARWALEVATADYAASTRYQYWLTVARIAEYRGKLDDWDRHLRGPWRTLDGRREAATDQGGRPRREARRLR
jgi:hypothetical protein